MSNRAIQRILKGTAVAGALTLAGLTAAEDVAAQQPNDNDMSQMMDDVDDEMDWGWLGLLGLAGLIGLRRRDDRDDVRPVSRTTRHPQP